MGGSKHFLGPERAVFQDGIPAVPPIEEPSLSVPRLGLRENAWDAEVAGHQNEILR